MARDPVHPSFDVKGEWWRFERYTILDGAIVPTPGAHLLEYDPWKPYRANVFGYRTVDRPYTPLLELWRYLDRSVDSDGESPDLAREIAAPSAWQGKPEDAVLAWCQENGLLGIVPVIETSITLPPVQLAEDPTAPWVQKKYERVGGRWRSEDEPVTPLLAKFSSREVVFDRLQAGSSFFPTGVEFIPRPSTREFFRVYREPVEEFISFAAMFGLCVDRVCGLDERADHLPQRFTQSVAHGVLDRWSQGCASSFRINEKTGRSQAVSLSAGLLASYALMFLWDHAEGRRALRCKNCCRYFISNDPRATYCSPKCRNTAQVRRHRHNRDTRKY
jgi:hypothetical protein